MEILTQLFAIIYFFVTSYGLGRGFLLFIDVLSSKRFREKHGEQETIKPVLHTAFFGEILERYTMTTGLGICVFILLGVIFDLVGVPLHWWSFGAAAVSVAVYDFYRQRASKKVHQTTSPSTEHHATKSIFSVKKTTLFSAFAFVVALLAFLMYTTGAFSYSYLEDGDPWHHALSVKYVAQEKTLTTQFPSVFRYLDAYPPAYAFLLGMTYQISEDMVWNLKFFNALFISLGILFFYFSTLALFKNSQLPTHQVHSLALISTVVLALIPAYFSHFIWSHTLSVALFFPLFYFLLRSEEHSRLLYAGAICIGALILTQPSQPIKALVMLAILGVFHCITNKKMISRYAIAIILGVLLSTLWWGHMIIKHDDVLRGGLGQNPTTNERWNSATHFGPLGSATRMYTTSDFFSASSQNLITAPVGIGFVPMILFIVGILFSLMLGKKLFTTHWQWAVILFWTAFTFAGLFGGTVLPLALFTFRFWLIFPIPVAILCAYGIVKISEHAKKIGIVTPITVVVLLVLVAWSAGAAKYELNTMVWGSEPAMTKYGQQDSYEYLRNLADNTRVFDVCHRDKFGDTVLVAYDKYACPWCADERDFRESIITKDGWTVPPKQLLSFARAQEYSYIFLEGNCIDTLQKNMKERFNITVDPEFAQNSTNRMIGDLATSGLFTPVHNTQGSVIFLVQ